MKTIAGNAAFQHAFMATLRIEIALKFRHRMSLFRILALVALCASLVPPPGANYAILHIQGRAPLMSADTALATAAVVLNAIVLAIYGLMLDIGRIRDRRLQLLRLLATQPLSIRAIALGRVSANIAYACVTALLAAAALSTTLLARYGDWPDAESFALFACIVLPVLVASATIAMAIDLLLPEKPWLRILVLACVWSALLVLSLFGIFDVVGIGALKELIGDRYPTQQLAMGFIKSESAEQFPWRDFAAPLSQIATERFALLCLLTSITVLGAIAFGGRLLRLQEAQLGRRTVAADGRRLMQMAVPKMQPIAALVVRTRHIPELTGIRMTSSRLMRRSNVAIALLAGAFLIGASGGSTGIASIMLLFVPFLLLAGTSTEELRVATGIEQCEPALTGIGPSATHASAIFLPVALASLPSLFRMDPMQALTATLGVYSITAWLVWTHRDRDQPLLGISVAGAVLYGIAFNDVPAAADILGIWKSDPLATLISGVVAAIVTTLIAPRKRS